MCFKVGRRLGEALAMHRACEMARCQRFSSAYHSPVSLLAASGETDDDCLRSGHLSSRNQATWPCQLLLRSPAPCESWPGGNTVSGEVDTASRPHSRPASERKKPATLRQPLNSHARTCLMSTLSPAGGFSIVYSKSKQSQQGRCSSSNDHSYRCCAPPY